jgi:outer membrane protein assembly factor BamB
LHTLNYYRRVVIFGLLLAVFAVAGWESASRAENWPGYRGPTGMGTTTETDLPIEWDSAEMNVLWKAPLPTTADNVEADHNQSSPIVWGDRVFVTTALWPGADKSDVPEQHVTCVRTNDGAKVWDIKLPPGPWKLTDLRGGYCAPTPVTDGQRVYVLFGSSMLAAVDWNGELVWHKEIADWQAFDVAIASSPILHRGQLLVLADRNDKKSTLTAYDPASGEVIWESKRPEVAFAHTTPVVATIGGRELLLVGASNELQALDPKSGDRIWWCRTPGDVTSPVVSDGLVYTDSGRGGPGVLVDGSGSGDITATHVKWRVDQIPEGLSSPVIAGGYVYRLHNPGVLKCFELKSGKQMYAKRLEGISVASSPIATPDGRIYFASAGKTFVVQAGSTFELLATNDLGEPTAASAAVSGGRIYLKGNRHLFCVGKN